MPSKNSTTGLTTHPLPLGRRKTPSQKSAVGSPQGARAVSTGWTMQCPSSMPCTRWRRTRSWRASVRRSTARIPARPG